MEKVVRFKDEYIMAAELSQGLFRVAAVDCSIDAELCEDFKFWTMPQVLVFSAKGDNQDGEKFLGPFDKSNLI